MRYIEQNLVVGEKIIYLTKPHWILFGWPMFFLLFAAADLILGALYVEGQWHLYVGGLLILLAVLTGCSPLLAYLTSEFGLVRSPSWKKYVEENQVEDVFLKSGGLAPFLDEQAQLMRSVLQQAGVTVAR